MIDNRKIERMDSKILLLACEKWMGFRKCYFFIFFQLHKRFINYVKPNIIPLKIICLQNVCILTSRETLSKYCYCILTPCFLHLKYFFVDILNYKLVWPRYFKFRGKAITIVEHFPIFCCSVISKDICQLKITEAKSEEIVVKPHLKFYQGFSV